MSSYFDREIFSQDPSMADVYAFAEAFPERMQRVVLSMMNGQILTDGAFHENAEIRTSQHPKFAVSSDSKPSGHERFFVGDSAAGLTLVLRSLDSLWRDADQKITQKTEAFFELVAHKGIPFIVHARGCESPLIGLAYDHWSGKGDPTKPLDSVLMDHVNGLQNLYLTVQKNGIRHYADLGVDMSGTPDIQFKKAMAIQQLLWDFEKAPKGHRVPGVVSVYQDEGSGEYYVWSSKTKQFARVESTQEEAIRNAPILDILRDQYSPMQDAASEAQATVLREEACSAVLSGLVKGARHYKSFLSEPSCALEAADTSLCSDSRSTSKYVVGPSVAYQRWSLRSPGAFLTDSTGALDYESRLYFAYAAWRGRTVVHTHHATCGAMAVTKAFGDGALAGLGEGFRELGKNHTALYDAVMGRGSTDEKILSYYRRGTGVQVLSAGDCFGLEQLNRDFMALTKAGYGDNVVLAYQNMPEGRNYVLNPLVGQSGCLVPIPTTRGVCPASLVTQPGRPGSGGGQCLRKVVASLEA